MKHPRATSPRCLLGCISALLLAFWQPPCMAVTTDLPMAKELAEAVFVGKANLTAQPVDEKFKVYEGKLPADRSPKFLDLREVRAYGVTEKDVLRALLRHYSQSGKKDWEIGIGTEGQLYSWRVPWCEAVPPQFGPWADEVWQANYFDNVDNKILQAVSKYDPNETNMHNTVGRSFIQASTAFDRYSAPPGMAYFASPIVARYYDDKNKYYTTVNLAISPGLPTIFDHKILVYTRYRYVGDNVLEVTSFTYNFGPTPLTMAGCRGGELEPPISPMTFSPILMAAISSRGHLMVEKGLQYRTIKPMAGLLPPRATSKRAPRSHLCLARILPMNKLIILGSAY